MPLNESRLVGNSSKGILLMVLGVGFITMNDAMMKLVMVRVPVGEAIFFRGLFALLPALLLVQREGGVRALRWRNLRGQLLTAFLLAVPIYMFLYALTHLSLSIATVLLYVGPLMATALAALVLSEQVGWRQWVAVVIGFGGVTIVLGPSSGEFSWLVLLPLAVALLVAVRDLLVRRLLRHETSISVFIFSSVMVTLSAIPTFALGWSPLGMTDVALLAAAGLGFGMGIFLMTDALRFAGVSTVSPFKYSGVVWALLLSFLIWGETPDITTLIGAALVIGSGLFVLRAST